MVSKKNFISYSSKQIFHSNSKMMGQATNTIVIFCAQLLIQLTTYSYFWQLRHFINHELVSENQNNNLKNQMLTSKIFVVLDFTSKSKPVLTLLNCGTC